MKKINRTIWNLSICLFLILPTYSWSWASDNLASSISSKKLLADTVTFLASQPSRNPGTDGHQNSFNFIVDTLRNNQILFETPEVKLGFGQKLINHVGHVHVTTDIVKNIYGSVLGSNHSEGGKNKCVVLGAHYDGFYSAANDNATGVANILTLATILKSKANQLKYDYYFVFTDMEEFALAGADPAFAFIKTRCHEITLNMTFDMLGVPVTENMKNHVVALNSKLKPEHVAALVQTDSENSSVLRVVDLPINYLEFPVGPIKISRSDYRPFKQAGIPTLFFSTGMPSTYHTPNDTIATIDFELLEKINAWVYNFIMKLETLDTNSTNEKRAYKLKDKNKELTYLTDKLLESIETNSTVETKAGLEKNLKSLYLKVRETLEQPEKLTEFEYTMILHDLMSIGMYRNYGIEGAGRFFRTKTPFFEAIELKRSREAMTNNH